MSSRPVVLSALVLLSGCDLFSSVTVPASDNVSPTAIASVWIESSYEATSSGASPLSYTVTDPDKTHMAIGAIMDAGGAHSVAISAELVLDCDLGGIAQRQYLTYAPISQTQSGSVGDTVDNGVYTAHGIRFSSLSCTSGTLTQARFTWNVSGEDLHGNSASHNGAEMVYIP